MVAENHHSLQGIGRIAAVGRKKIREWWQKTTTPARLEGDTMRKARRVGVNEDSNHREEGYVNGSGERPFPPQMEGDTTTKSQCAVHRG